MTSFRTRSVLFGASAVAALTIGLSSAWAQDMAAPAESRETIGDIVVTARKTEENLQSTPVAVTALNEAALENARITTANELQATAPGLSVTTGSPGSSGFVFTSIRGSGNLNPGVANDPAVATYVDGVYIARPSQGLVDLNDVQRIEVLRGPQGTLFGRNTTGGAINLINNLPTGRFEGKIDVEAGNFDSRKAGLVVNVPLQGDVLAARFVYDYSQHDDYYKNLLDNTELGNRQSQFLRGALRYAPEDGKWDVTLAADFNRITDSGQYAALSGYNPASFGPLLAPYLQSNLPWGSTYSNPFQNDPNGRGPGNRILASGGSLTINGEIGAIGVKSISGIRYSNASGVNDLDGTPLQILGGESGFLSRQYSQELQFTGDIGDRFNWITGLYYSQEKGREFSDAQAFGFVGAPIFRNDGDIENKSAGVFVQGYYQATDQMRIAAGLRWTQDERNVVLHNKNIFNLPGNVPFDTDPITPGFQPNCNVFTPDNGVLEPCNQTLDKTFDYPSWTLDVDYQWTPDIFLYAKTSGASKAGGFNTRLGSVPAFDPEQVKDIELGAKTNWLEDRLRLNVAAFYIWQSDVQRNATKLVGNNISTQFLTNAGNARVYGGEFELTALPWEGMTVSANLSLMDGEYEEGTFFDERANGTRLDRSGETPPQLPDVQFSLSGTQELHTSVGEFTLFANYAYIGSQAYDSITFDPLVGAPTQAVVNEQNRLAEVDSYGLLNARLAWRPVNSNFEVAVFGSNLTDEEYVTRSFSNTYSTLGTALVYIGDPQTYGVGVTYRWGE